MTLIASIAPLHNRLHVSAFAHSIPKCVAPCIPQIDPATRNSDSPTIAYQVTARHGQQRDLTVISSCGKSCSRNTFQRYGGTICHVLCKTYDAPETLWHADLSSHSGRRLRSLSMKTFHLRHRAEHSAMAAMASTIISLLTSSHDPHTFQYRRYSCQYAHHWQQIDV